MRRFYEQTLCILHKFLLANQDLHHGLLAALDQIKAMLDEAAGGGEANRAVSAEILLKVRQLTGKPEPRPAEAAPSPELAPAADARGPVLDWHIRFSPGADLLRTGTNPLLLLRELKQLGSLQIKASMAAVPPIGELDPEALLHKLGYGSDHLGGARGDLGCLHLRGGLL
jgi:two-component system chemotaxis sensor kinase CheA